ncbi:hypothetical protein G4B88_022912 [Cannabis sativa]|uniref:Uncharacterized protein n=1 Tax=Cannabis sativa TaxID=3483 RepID=A0A7J6DRP8_CANSA|nr:hypothetical protein G4B88_022912 [Cannabis sativa]
MKLAKMVDNIPFLYLTSENAQKLGLQAGEVLQIDEDAEEKPKWIEWLRFRVGVKASLPHFIGLVLDFEIASFKLPSPVNHYLLIMPHCVIANGSPTSPVRTPLKEDGPSSKV